MRLPEPVRNAYGYIKQVLHEYSADNGSLVAAAVSFYVFLSLIPMLLLAVAVMAFFIGSPDRAAAVLQSKLQGYASFGAQGESAIKQIIHTVVSGRSAATGIGVIALLWSGTSLITTLEEAVNVMCDVRERRSFLMRRLVAILMFVVIAVLLGTAIGVTAATTAIRESNIPIFGAKGHMPVFWVITGYLVSLSLTIAAFTAAYKILPYAPIPLRSALLGGVIAGVLWEIAKILFSYYVTHFANYNKIYGSLGGIILILIWINYTSAITLLAAEIIALKEGRKTPP